MTVVNFIASALNLRSRNAYELIDTPSDPGSPLRRAHCTPHLHTRSAKRATVFAISFTPILAFATGLIIYHFVFRLVFVDRFIYGVPDLPNYDQWEIWEDRLPQHNSSLEYPEGHNGRYVMFSNQAWGYGLNNQLQESILLSHVAYLSNRAYTFQPYTWDAKAKSKAVLDGRHWRSAKIPLTAFIAGPTAGGSFGRGDRTPRAVNTRWWDKVCPPNRRTYIDVAEENVKWGVDETTQGSMILHHWSTLLKRMDDPCVEITGPVIFDFALIASPRVLSLWPSLSISPILSRFQWSSLILNAVSRNLPLFSGSSSSSLSSSLLSDYAHSPPPSHSTSSRLPVTTSSSPSEDFIPVFDDRRRQNAKAPPLAPLIKPRRPPPISSTFGSQSSSHPTSTNVTTAPPIPGLVALHLRRGDFRIHCHWLADRSEPFAGWNQFQFLLDRFTPPEIRGMLGRGKNHETYMERCWPDIPRIVERLNELQRLHNGTLDKVFLLTNGRHDWLEQLKEALVDPPKVPEIPTDDSEAGSVDITPRSRLPVTPSPEGTPEKKRGWKMVLTSKDVVLSKNEKEVDQAVDMEIARRAEVFVGNGFSSLTSNIVMLRLSDSTPLENIRFW